MLKVWGLESITAGSGLEAMEILRSQAHEHRRCQLMLSDCEMPVMSGFDLVEAIRQDANFDGLKIVMLKCKKEAGGPSQREQDLGIAGSLSKPFRRRDLRAAIVSALGGVEAVSNVVASRPSPILKSFERKSLRILVAEDNLVNQRVVKGMLEKQGYSPVIVSNGRDALRALESNAFDVVLIDVQMPEMDGLEATKAIRRREAETGKRQPIVAMTAHAMTGDRERCLEAGMDDYLSKPIDSQKLAEILSRINAHVGERVAV